MPEITINGEAISATDTQTVMEAALQHGIDIPAFCYHPALSVAGNCRLCLVEQEGRGLGIACKMPVQEGMRICTHSEAVLDARRAMLQFFTLNHPVDCGICDKSGECLLQDYHYQYNGTTSISAEPKLKRTKFYALSSRILLDNERCVLCSRCVRFTHEISGSKALGFVYRADEALLRPAEPDSLERDMYADNIIDLCPVGALLSRSFLYRARVWYLQATPSVCPGCARGCNIEIWHRKTDWQLHAPAMQTQRRIERVTPLANPHVNGFFICNKGRDLATIWERPRLLQARIAGVQTDIDTAIDKVREWIASTYKRFAVLSSWGSNEELEAFHDQLCGVFHTVSKSDQLPQPGEIFADDWLICEDKNPNMKKIQELFGTDLSWVATDADLVLVWGEGFAVHECPSQAKLIYLTAYKDCEPEIMARADVVIPISTQTERAGHYTNINGQVSPFQACFAKPASVIDAQELFHRLALQKAHVLNTQAP